jgi:hypothetical protein
MLSRIKSIFSMLALALMAQFASADLCVADDLKNAEIAARLVVGYPDYVEGLESTDLKLKDGTLIPLGDGKAKSFNDWLAHPSIRDMFLFPYPRGATAVRPEFNFDPGRGRNEEFFTEVYGDCRKPGFASSLTTVPWLPKRSGQPITVSARNGVAAHLKAVSDELDQLPSSFDTYLIPSAGGYVCRAIAGTRQRSGHAYGIAIDIATKHSHYWRWGKRGASGDPVYRNDIPVEIVRIFEKHGFIWGGRWYHYDTMHFEYRPELIGVGE